MDYMLTEKWLECLDKREVVSGERETRLEQTDLSTHPQIVI